MKKNILFLVLMLVTTGRVVMAETYSLEGYLEAVRNHNKDLKLAAKDREMATFEKKEAVSAALPKVGIETGYNYNFTDYYMYFDKSALMPDASGVAKAPFKRDNEYSASVALQQTLYSPIVGKAIEAADQYRNVTDFVYEASIQNVMAGAKKLFYQCLLIEKVVEVSRASEINAHDNYSDMKLKYDNGQVSQLELLLAETRWRNAVPETLKAERNLSLALYTLKNLAGIDLDREIDLAGKLDEIPELPDSVTVDAVVGTRPDFQALVWEGRLRKTAMNAAHDAYKPTLTGTIAYTYSGQSNEFKLAEENKFLFAGVKLSVPLYTGGAIDANVQKARVELDKTTVKMEKTRETISIDLKNIYLRMREAKLRMESAEVTRSTAEKAFIIAETTTREGLTTQLQLKDARFGFDQAVIGYYAAVYDYMAAYSDWELTVGRIDTVR
ncbi:TolC family protein [bacterium]|nr:TolC family protein [bacterium]